MIYKYFKGKQVISRVSIKKIDETRNYICHDEFVSVNNVLREYNEMKEEIENPENL